DNLWRESKKTKSLLKFFSVNESKKHAEKGSYSTDDEGPEKSYNRLQLTGLILGPVLFILTLLFLEAEGLDSAGVFVSLQHYGSRAGGSLKPYQSRLHPSCRCSCSRLAVSWTAARQPAPTAMTSSSCSSAVSL